MAQLRLRTLFSALALAVAFPIALAACAQGTSGSGDDDDGIDARNVTIDSGFGADARVDAQVTTPIDAPVTAVDAPVSVPDGGGGLFCSSTADCSGTPGTCCFYLGQPPGFCVPGTEIVGVCLPSGM